MSDQAADPRAPTALRGGGSAHGGGNTRGSAPQDTSIKDAARSTRSQATRPARSKSKIALISAAIVTPLALGGLWVAVHSIPWMGPLVANTLRSTIGKENVTRLEDFVYAIEDRVNRTVKSDAAPRTYWKVPKKTEAVAAVVPTPTAPVEDTPVPAPAEPALEPFAPKDPGPAHDKWVAEGDGVWVPMIDPRRPDEPPRMFKTLLHADSSRSWSELFVVAVDLRQVAVMPVMGYQEPRTDKPEAQGYVRPAKIPAKHYGALLGAFNGGFMAEHGGYGVYFDGITFLDPKDDACTLASYRDGTFSVASWTHIKERVGEMRWYRQAPNCMYEDGEMHPNLKVQYARKWGATLDGNTVIRRSAVGLSPDGKILYVGISNHTTAKVMAAGMFHAGAASVAQMDVNWSYPKFVTYELHKDDLLYPVALADGFEFSDKLYLRERSMRDFFYLARLEDVAPDLEQGDLKLFPASEPSTEPEAKPTAEQPEVAQPDAAQRP